MHKCQVFNERPPAMYLYGPCVRLSKRGLYPLCLILLAGYLASVGRGDDQKSSREEARFDIYVAGKEIGQEKFAVLFSADSSSSSSILNFRDPGGKHRKVRIETQLDMDPQFLPRAYKLNLDVDGQKGAMNGRFMPGQAMFEYEGTGSPVKRGLLAGDRYTLLDTNVFHHFIFIARLFDLSSAKDSQSVEVIVPQEMNNGTLRIREIGMEKLQAQGKKRDLHRLRADSGQLQIDLWIDDRNILYKIAIPNKKIEVIRN